MKNKAKKKKIKSPSFGELYVDLIKMRDNSPKQRKFNKLMIKPNKTAADMKLLAKLLSEGSKQFKAVKGKVKK